MRVLGLNHVELLVPADRQASVVDTFAALLGTSFTPPRVPGAGQVLMSYSAAGGLEVTAPGSPDSPLNGALARRKSPLGQVGPIAWRVADLQSMRRAAEAHGIAIVDEMEHEGSRSICLSPADCHGYLATFVESPSPYPVPGEPDALVLRLNRVELLVPSERVAAAAAFFARLLDTDMPVEHLAEHGVLSATSWQAGVEVFGPAQTDHPLSRSLAAKGDTGSIGPIVWEVADIERLKRHATGLGHRVMYEFTTAERHQVTLSADTLFGYSATFTQRIA